MACIMRKAMPCFLFLLLLLLLNAERKEMDKNSIQHLLSLTDRNKYLSFSLEKPRHLRVPSLTAPLVRKIGHASFSHAQYERYRAFSAPTAFLSSTHNLLFCLSHQFKLSPLLRNFNRVALFEQTTRGTFYLLTNLRVLLGVNLSFDQVSVQGLPNSSRSVSQYYLKISIDNVLFATVQEGGVPKV